jgi:O-antigen ligase
LLTPFWGRRDQLLARCHLRAIIVVLATVVVGVMLAPGQARAQGRLAGVIWPIPPPQVAHYAAVGAGIALVLWMCNRMRRSQAFAIGGAGILIMLLSHTRTALLALVAGLVFAGLSLLLSRKRVRRAAMAAMIVVPLVAIPMAPAISTWFNRDQSAEQLGDLTGRKTVWDRLVSAPRSELVQWIGSGLSDKSFDGLPIDSTWLALYQDEGLVGVGLVAGIMVVLLFKIVTHQDGPERALATFLLTYCAVSSYTEVGPGDASPYTLALIVAASLLTSDTRARRMVGGGRL